VQEAMAAGLPIIASDSVGAARELVTDRVSGRIFPVGDVGALKQAILDVTASDAVDEYRFQAKHSLAKWREKLDPVEEIRRALMACEVLAKS
jgi:glycosyltransferase involved in cell wall biosynthesis